MEKKRLKAYGLLLLTATFWGCSSPIVKYTLSFIDPVGFLFYRFILVSLLFLIPFLIAIKKNPLAFPQFIKLLFIGIIGGPTTLLLIFYGADKTTAINASLIVAMAPVFIVLAGAWFLKEKVTKREFLGLAVAVFGTIFTVIQPILSNGGFEKQHLQGNILLLLHNIVWTIYCILIKKESKRYSPIVLTAITFFSGLLILPPLFFLKNTAIPLQTILSNFDLRAIPGILYMSIFSSIIAYTTYNWGISLIEASEATIFTYLQPLFATPLAFFWLGEKITPPFLFGASFVALGVFLSEYRESEA